MTGYVNQEPRAFRAEDWPGRRPANKRGLRNMICASHGRVAVNARAAPTLWPTNGCGPSFRGERHAWALTLREDNGWVIGIVKPLVSRLRGEVATLLIKSGAPIGSEECRPVVRSFPPRLHPGSYLSGG